MPAEEGNIMFELKNLDRLFKKTGDAMMRGFDSDSQLTRMHYWIIGFIFHNDDRDIFQRDIENEFKISRSTTSSMISLMEKKGLVTRASVDDDARLKKLTLTERARSIHIKQMDNMHEMQRLTDSALTPEEKKEFLRMVAKLSAKVSSWEAEHADNK